MRKLLIQIQIIVKTVEDTAENVKNVNNNIMKFQYNPLTRLQDTSTLMWKSVFV